MSYSHVTLSFSLPRSRSQWLSWLYGHAVKSWHDPLKHCTHPLDLKRMIDEHGQDRLFIADTAAILFHRTITESLPGAKFLYVVRPLDDVLLSMRRQVGSPLTKTMTHMHQRLRTFARDALPNHACSTSRLTRSRATTGRASRAKTSSGSARPTRRSTCRSTTKSTTPRRPAALWST